MAEVVNLRLARKARNRAQAADAATANRARHGVPKAERLLGKAERARAEKLLDGAKRQAD